MIRSTLRMKGIFARYFHATSFNRIREIVKKKEGNVTKVEGKILPSPRTPFLIKEDPNVVQNACILCRLNLDIKQTDVLILHQFITKEGIIIPRVVTGLCYKQYFRIKKLVEMAQEAGLLGNFVTWEGEVDISNRTGYKKFNTYFDEKTINNMKNKGILRKLNKL